MLMPAVIRGGTPPWSPRVARTNPAGPRGTCSGPSNVMAAMRKIIAQMEGNITTSIDAPTTSLQTRMKHHEASIIALAT